MRIEIYADYNLRGKKGRLSTQRVNGQVMKLNSKTLWVETPDGNVIKRHMQRHHVVLRSTDGSY